MQRSQSGVDRARASWQSLSDSLEEYLQTDDSW